MHKTLEWIVTTLIRESWKLWGSANKRKLGIIGGSCNHRELVLWNDAWTWISISILTKTTMALSKCAINGKTV